MDQNLQDLLREMQSLRGRLQDAEAVLGAIASGQVDAFVVSDVQGDRVIRLEGGGHAYEVLLEEMREAAVTLSLNGAILSCNGRFARIVKVPREQLRGEPMARFVAPGTRHAFEQLLTEAAQKSVTGEVQLAAPDGACVSVQVSLSPLPPSETPGICVVATDLTERLQIVAAEELARSILEQAVEPIVVCDSAGVVVRASRAAVRICGGDPLGQAFDAAYPLRSQAGHGPEQALCLSEVVCGKTVRDREAQLAIDGTARHLLVSAGPLTDKTGTAVGCVISLLDVTRRRDAEARLQSLASTLEQRVAERTTQLRALAAELSQAEQRERRRLAQVLHDHLQQLLVGAKFNIGILRGQLQQAEPSDALRQVEELLDESLATSRSLTVELSPPMLYESDLVQALEWLGRWMHDKHGLEVQVVAARPRTSPAEDVRILLFQCVRELLFNIVKHAHVRSAEVRVRTVDGSRVEVTIADQGAGFDPRNCRLRHAGSGLGLLSIRERIEWMGGSFELQSAPRKGTRVRLIVPAAPSAESSRDRSASDAGAAREQMPHARSGSAEPCTIRVLLADDHAVVRDGLARLLQMQQGIEVVGQAADGQEAVDLARQLEPDVMVMDVSMPGMNGVEATRRVVAEMPTIRVIGLSMHAESDMAKAMQDAGAIGYLTKSTDPAHLVAAIRSLCQ